MILLAFLKVLWYNNDIKSNQLLRPTISWKIETEQDIDKYLAQLKARILKELAEDTVVNIEF